MVFDMICSSNFDTPEHLARNLTWRATATLPILSSLLMDLGYGRKVREVLNRTISNEDKRKVLIQLYANAHFLGSFERRMQEFARRQAARLADAEAAVQMDELTQKRNRAELILRELPLENHSKAVQEYLDRHPWECAICFERQKDPLEVFVTCWGDHAEREASAQHAACTKCSERLQRCHMCRRRAEHLPLPEVWNKKGLAMQMGVNPFLVRC